MKTIEREDLNFLLQKCSLEDLRQIHKKIKNKHDVKVLQEPTEQTLLQPVFDPISGGDFYAGEVLVTTTIVQLDNSSNQKGWAMVQDKNEELSFLVATCDAAFAMGLYKEEIACLARQSLERLEKEQQQTNQKVNATKVKFDLMY